MKHKPPRPHPMPPESLWAPDQTLSLRASNSNSRKTPKNPETSPRTPQNPQTATHRTSLNIAEVSFFLSGLSVCPPPPHPPLTPQKNLKKNVLDELLPVHAHRELLDLHVHGLWLGRQHAGDHRRLQHLTKLPDLASALSTSLHKKRAPIRKETKNKDIDI